MTFLSFDAFIAMDLMVKIVGGIKGSVLDGDDDLASQ